MEPYAPASPRRGARPAESNTTLCLLPVVLAIVCAIGSAGCDTEIAPFTEVGTFSYSVTGYLDTAADTQWVRISELRQDVDLPSVPSLATVVTTALSTQQNRNWTDSVWVTEDGTAVQLYYASFVPEPGETYQLTVKGTGGLESRASTTVPIDPGLDVSDPVRNLSNQQLSQTVKQFGVERTPRSIVMSYKVKKGVRGLPQTLAIPYVQYGLISGSDWETVVNLKRDASEVLRRLDAVAEDTVYLFKLSLYLERLDALWSVYGFDPFPKSNIEQGDGFLGSIGRFNYDWMLDSAYSDSLGFVPAVSTPGL